MNRNESLKLAILLGAATLLRFFLISKESLWLDEHASWWISGDFQRALTGEPTNPPFYYLLLHFWTRLFGHSETALRSLSILPSLAGIVCTYLLGRTLFTSRVAWIAAIYQTVCSFPIYYAQEARTFALVSFLIALSTLLLIKALDSERRTWLWVAAYALVTALSLYSHFISVFFLAGQGLYILFQQRARALLIYAAGAAAATLLFLPWLITLISTTATRGGQSGRRYLLLKLPQAYFSFLFGDTLVPLDEAAVRDVAGTLRHYLPVLLAATIATAVLGYLAFRLMRRYPAGLGIVVTMAVAPVLLCFVVSFFVPMFDERYLIATTTFVYLIIAAGMAEALEDWRQNKRLGAGAVMLFGGLVLFSLGSYYFNPRYGKEEWREAIAYLDSQASGADLVLLEPDYLRYGYMYYERKGVPHQPLTGERRQQLLSASGAALGDLNAYRRVWFLRSFYESDEFLHYLQKHFNQQQAKIFPRGKGIEIYEFSPLPPR